MARDPRLDEIGYWSEVKLEIIREYAKAYSTILAGQKKARLTHIYIDAFAGAGLHISKKTRELVPGSPLNALNVEPPFAEYHFIDLDGEKVQALADAAGRQTDVHIYEGDCNVVLKQILPRVRYEDYRRALCILDPYGLHLNWEIIQQIGEMRSIDIFLNFQVGDANRNVLWRNPEDVPAIQIERMNVSWGDDSWRGVAYVTKPDLFGGHEEKASNEDIAEAFRKRLQDVAGFAYVPPPMAMRNAQNTVVYYLFFASHNATGEKIAKAIFRKYSDRGRA